MWIELFFRGFLIGLLGSIPLGPVGVLCIQRTLSKNHRSGFISGLGASTADTLYAILALSSISFVMSFIQDNMIWFKVIGGLCIVAVGAKIFFSNPIIQIRRNRAGKSNLWQDYVSVFLITLTNPALLLVFVAFFTTFGISAEMGELNGISMLIGVFAGGTAWWFTLTFLVNLLRKRIRPRHLLWMNRIAGAIIVVLGAAAIFSSVINIHLNGKL